MKKIAAAPLALASLLAIAAVRTAPATALVDGVAARVNNRVVTVGEVVAALRPVEEELRKSLPESEVQKRLRKAYPQARDTLVERFLILDAYERQDAKLPDWVVDNQIEEQIQQKFKGDRAQLMDALARDHLSYEDWRRQMREFIIVSSMRRENVEQRAKVPPSEIWTHYVANYEDKYMTPAKVRLRTIEIPRGDTPESDAEAKRLAEELQQQLRGGADFAALARVNSKGKYASEGGDHGWNNWRDLLSELQEAVAPLKPGEVGPVVTTDKDYYLVRVDAREESASKPFEDVEQLIERELRRDLIERMYVEWIDRLKQKAYVSVSDANPYE